MTVGATAAFGAATLGAYAASSASAAESKKQSRAQQGEETKTLDTLYQDALNEGGDLIVYAGGDTPTQQDGTKAAFLAQFPKIKLNMIVDYSKFHDVRIDNQFATNTLVPDVIHLQTLQDFTRWSQQGRLLQYKPSGFSKVYDKFKDPQGAWMAIGVLAFSFMYDVAAAGSEAPKTPKELIDPKWSGKIASTYPNDDDAALFLYKLYAETYGWDWIAKLAAQNLLFARGSNFPSVAVNGHQRVIGIAGSGSLITPPTTPTRWTVADGHSVGCRRVMCWNSGDAFSGILRVPSQAARSIS